MDMSVRWQLLTTDECNKRDFGNFTKEYDASANCWSSDDEDVDDNMMSMTFEICFYLLIYYSPVPNCRGSLLAEMGWWNLSKSMKQVVVFRSNSYKGGT